MVTFKNQSTTPLIHGFIPVPFKPLIICLHILLQFSFPLTFKWSHCYQNLLTSLKCCVPCSTSIASMLCLAEKEEKGNPISCAHFEEGVSTFLSETIWDEQACTPAVSYQHYLLLTQSQWVMQLLNPGLLLALLNQKLARNPTHVYLVKNLILPGSAETGNIATSSNNREDSSSVLVKMIKSVCELIYSFYTRLMFTIRQAHGKPGFLDSY